VRNQPTESARSVPNSSLPEQMMTQLRDTRRRWTDITVNALVVIATVFAFALFISSVFGFARVDTENSNSMAPQITAGSDVLVVPEPASQVRIGQVIAFTPPAPYPSETVIHRVVSVHHALGHTVVETRGIANRINDPWRVVLPNTAWREVGALPYVGLITNFARAGIVQVLILIIVGISIAVGIEHIITRRKTKGVST
jgi:signal peptidase